MRDRDIKAELSLTLIQLIISLSVIAFFFWMWRRETVINTRLGIEEEIRLHHLHLYGKFPDADD